MKTRLFVAAIAIGLIASACSGSDDSGDGVATLETTDLAVNESVTGDDAVAELNTEEAMLAFAACMRDNGIDIEDPTVDADGNVGFGGLRGGQGTEGDFDREAIDVAMANCQEEIEGVALGFGSRGDFDLTTMQDTFVEYAACMRDNGYDMDDPDLSNFASGSSGGPPAGGGIFGEIDRDDPDYLAAQEVCESVLTGAFGDVRIPGTGQGRGGGGGE